MKINNLKYNKKYNWLINKRAFIYKYNFIIHQIIK